MRTAADYRRAELRRKLRRAEEQLEGWRWIAAVYRKWSGRFAIRRHGTACRQIAYWSDIARILRRTLREEGKGTR